jgi:enoyl-CoA hydratase/carnithine racemase
MVLTGDYITARQALDWGYVDEVVPPEKLEETTLEWAKKLAGKSPVALKLMKKAFWQTRDMTPGEALPHIEELFARHAASEAGQAAIKAFLEKRTPPWLADVEIT